MKRKLIIDGNAVYEIGEDGMLQTCLREPDVLEKSAGDEDGERTKEAEN